jgi:hypothetical protein
MVATTYMSWLCPLGAMLDRAFMTRKKYDVWVWFAQERGTDEAVMGNETMTLLRAKVPKGTLQRTGSQNPKTYLPLLKRGNVRFV